MCKELTENEHGKLLDEAVERGQLLAVSLVRHLKRIGACSARIPIVVEGESFEVRIDLTPHATLERTRDDDKVTLEQCSAALRLLGGMIDKTMLEMSKGLHEVRKERHG